MLFWVLISSTSQVINYWLLDILTHISFDILTHISINICRHKTKLTCVICQPYVYTLPFFVRISKMLFPSNVLNKSKMLSQLTFDKVGLIQMGVVEVKDW